MEYPGNQFLTESSVVKNLNYIINELLQTEEHFMSIYGNIIIGALSFMLLETADQV